MVLSYSGIVHIIVIHELEVEPIILQKISNDSPVSVNLIRIVASNFAMRRLLYQESDHLWPRGRITELQMQANLSNT